ncbi:MAG: heparinase II/III family protein, partial [Pikeienuella sp.]
ALARFHGGGRGAAERIDRALDAYGARPGAPVRQAMGYRRLASGGTTIIFDAGDDERPVDQAACAGLFCFEAALGRRPFVVNCGPGARLGPEWDEATRAAAAHNGLSLDDTPMAAPGHVSAVREGDETGLRLIAEHDGWMESRGLIHQRRIFLSGDGGDLRGTDLLTAAGPGPRAAFDQGTEGLGARFTLRFHLHPDVEAELFLAGSAVKLRPGGGETWIMRQSGGALSLEKSAYIDEDRIAPRATKQIVVRALMKDYRGEVKWTFRRAETATPAASAAPAEA